MRIILIFILSLLTVSMFGQATTGTRVTSTIVPNDESDVYPTHEAKYGKDGYRSVLTITERDAIKTNLRKEGMLVWVKADSVIYQLVGGILNTNWKYFFKSTNLEDLNNLIATKLNASDTIRYISKSQARKDIHDSIAPLRADVNYLKQLTDTTSELVARTIYVSLPNDPQTPGSDVTGDGSISKPFATLTKGLQAIKKGFVYDEITIQLDSGSFYLSIHDKLIIEDIANKSNSPYASSELFIQGQVSKRPNTLSVSVKNNFTITYTGTQLKKDSLEGCFLGSSTSPSRPIEGNQNDTIFAAGTSSSHIYIYDIQTKLIISDPQTLHFNHKNSLYLRQLNIDLTTSSYFNEVYIRYCNINSLVTAGFSISCLNTRISYCKVNTYLNSTTAIVMALTNNSELYNSVLKNKSSARSLALRILSTGQYSDIIISNYGTAITFYGDAPLISKGSGPSFMFKNTDIGVSNQPAANGCMALDALILYMYKTPYLVRNYSNSPVKIYAKSVIGDKFIVYHPSSVSKELCNPLSGTFINLPGIYPEYQIKQTTTLINNSTDSISIADLSYNRSINIDYTITRNGQYRTGSMKVLNTGTTYLFDPGDYIESADVGVSFQGVYKSGNSNTLKLKWTTTNTGQNATIQCDYRRQNF